MSLPEDRIAALAHRQLRDYRARQPGTCFADPAFTLDLAAAYELQDAVHALRVAEGERVIGYKVGCTGPGTVEQFGMAGPIRGCLYAGEVHRSGATIEAGRFATLAIEGEMAIRLGEDGGIETVFPVIELHHFVFRGPRKTLAELVANNGLQGGIVVPDEPAGRDQAAVGTMSVRINGRTFGPASPWPHKDGAETSLAWLRGHLAGAGLALAPGQLVLAGTALGLYPVGPGDDVSVEVDGFPPLRCTVT